MPSTHAVLPPSGAKQWSTCTPSARLNEAYRERFGEDASPYAEEGTKAHALCELKLRHFLKEISLTEYTTGVAELEPTLEMEQAADYYAGICREYFEAARSVCPDALMLVEQRLDISKWVPNSFGTGDCVIVSDEQLDVIDFKYGRGVPVSAVDNPQARCYGLGALYEFGDLYGFDKIRNTIVQPRLDSVTEETLTRKELLDWGDWLKPIAEKADRGEGEFVPGDHCRFCLVKAICAKRVTESLAIIDEGLTRSPTVTDDHTVAAIYRALPLVKDWIKNFEDYVKSQALRGQKIEGFKLVRGKKPARAFRDIAEVERILVAAGYEAAQYSKAPELKSVAELEKLMGKSAFKALLEEQIVQGEGALTLVPEDDKRPEYNSADAAFADLV